MSKASNPIVIITKIYGPIIISAVLLLLLFSLRQEEDLGRIEINPTFLGISILKYGLPVSNIWLARAILLCLSIAVLSLLIFMDYSDFFPNHFKMEVFFDKKGIRDSLKVFSKEEFKRLGIPDNYEEFQNRYYDDVKVEVRKIFQKGKDFLIPPENIHSQGETSIYVEKLPGVQKYHIKESEGKLTHAIEKPNTPMLQFKSFFEKLNSKHDYLTLSLKEMFIKHRVILQPRYKQIFAENLKSEGKSFNHTLVSLTKVNFFPYPKLSNTIYLTDLNEGVIPIGYAIYS
jgi:hypothetical protein